MSAMSKIQEGMEKRLMPIAGKISNQKYLKAISAGMISMMPCSLAGSFALLLMSSPMESATMDPGIARAFFAGWETLAATLYNPLYHIYTVANSLSAIIACIGIAWTLAKNYGMEDKEGIIPTSLSLMLFLITAVMDVDMNLTFDNLGGTGYFAAIVMGIVGVEAYRFVIKHNIGVINITGSMVPPAITASFRGMIPGSLIVAVVAFLNWGFTTLTGSTFPEIMSWIMSPLVKAIDNPVGLFVLALLVGVFWWFGIHDTCITSPLGVLWTPMALANAAAYVAGTSTYELPYIVTSPFWWCFLTIGGSGATLALAILLLTAKSKHLKTVGRMGIVPAIFNINEPIIFGIPLMLNPTMMIPFVLVMPINGLITYFCMYFGVIGRFFTSPTWNLPTPIQALLGTLDWKAAVLNILLIVLDMLIYYPFFKVYDKEKVREENADTVAAE